MMTTVCQQYKAGAQERKVILFSISAHVEAAIAHGIQVQFNFHCFLLPSLLAYPPVYLKHEE